jgi:hypothetical protein
MYRHYDPKSESIEDAHIEPQPHQNASQWTQLVSLVNGHDGGHGRHDGRHDAHDSHHHCHHVHGLALSMRKMFGSNKILARQDCFCLGVRKDQKR